MDTTGSSGCGIGLEGLNLTSPGKNKFKAVGYLSIPQDRAAPTGSLHPFMPYYTLLLFFLPKNTMHLHYRKCIWLSFFNQGVLKTEAAETPSSPVNIPWQWAPQNPKPGEQRVRECEAEGGEGFWMHSKENITYRWCLQGRSISAGWDELQPKLPEQELKTCKRICDVG